MANSGNKSEAIKLLEMAVLIGKKAGFSKTQEDEVLLDKLNIEFHKQDGYNKANSADAKSRAAD
jgi:hypothetical protein